MAGQYSLKKFLRLAPNALLRKYLEDKGIRPQVDWDRLPEARVDPLFEAIDTADIKVRQQIERDFRDIDAMADEGGVTTLIQEARFPKHELEIADEMGRKRSHHERAFWVFLKHSKVFGVARHFRHADNLSGHSWRKRRNLPPCEAATDAESKERLKDQVSAYYRRKDGRGHVCHVEHYRRGSRLYWFCYPEDYAGTYVGYDKRGELKVLPQRPAFDVIFIYYEDNRSLDIYVRGDKATVADLQRIFGRTILGVELDEVAAGEVVYQLNDLLDRDFPFATKAEDGVEAVTLRGLRLRIAGRENRRVTLEADPAVNRKAVWDLLDDVTKGLGVPREMILVTQATIQLTFRADDSGRPRSLAFSVSHPEACSLKDDPLHDVARDLLKRWGLDVSGLPETAPARRGRSAQYVFRG